MAVAGKLTYNTDLDKKGFEKGLSSLENTANKAMKGIVAGLAAITTGVVAVGTASIKSYADLEQNIGGVETLFKGSADKVKKYANEAYKTAGVSANKYMETTTSFAASLLQSLKGDTEKAAEVSNMALIDMADNSNKMGTAMESIQYAYQGFAKQNYTMLDNLKLGYGGTKEEMQRLLKDAQKLTGVKYDISNLNDIFQAIHVIQGELGITGTTAKEAEETISGSINSLKASWDNFLNGSGNFDTVVENAKTAFNNIWKAVKEQLPRIAKDIVDLLPEGFIKTVKIITPIAVSLGTALGIIWGYFKMVAIVQTITKAFGVLNAIMAANPILLIVAAIAALVVAFVYLWNTSEGFRNFWIGLWDTIKETFENVWNGIVTFFTDTIPNAFQSLKDKISEIGNNIKQFFINVWNGIVSFFTEGIPNFIQSVIQWFQQLPYQIGYHIGQILGNIILFGTNAWNWITTELPQIIQGIIDWFAQLPGKIWEWLCNAVNNIVNWGRNTYNTAVTWVTNTISAVVNWFKQLPGRIWSCLQNVINNVANWGKNMAQKGKEGAVNLFNNIVNTIKELPGKMLDTGKNIVEGLWNGIKNAKDWIVGKVKEFAQGVLDGMKNALGIHSPSRVFRDQVGKFIPQGIAVGIKADTDSAIKAIDNMNKDIMREMNKAVALETGSINANASLEINRQQPLVIARDSNKTINIDNTQNFYEKVQSPYETAKQTKNTMRRLAYGY